MLSIKNLTRRLHKIIKYLVNVSLTEFGTRLTFLDLVTAGSSASLLAFARRHRKFPEGRCTRAQSRFSFAQRVDIKWIGSHSTTPSCAESTQLSNGQCIECTSLGVRDSGSPQFIGRVLLFLCTFFPAR
jgi:hypothetical protein